MAQLTALVNKPETPLLPLKAEEPHVEPGDDVRGLEGAEEEKHTDDECIDVGDQDDADCPPEDDGDHDETIEQEEEPEDPKKGTYKERWSSEMFCVHCIVSNRFLICFLQI